MKKIMLVLLVMVILICGCAWRFTTHISGIESKWGPPAKVVKNDATVTYFWHFEEGRYSTTWVTYEFVCDREGKIISKRSYNKQPESK